MLTEVKNNIRVALLSLKFSFMRAMLNKLSFFFNVAFMILNNASFIILWIVFYSLQDNIGGSSFENILILWGLMSGTYGISHILFDNAFKLSDIINSGKLDAYLVQPKNVLMQSIINLTPSSFGDLIYAYILLFIVGCSIKRFLLYTIFIITGSLIITSISIIFNSLSFWFRKSDTLASQVDNIMTQFSIYPEGIFDNVVRIILYLVVPVGFVAYIPVNLVFEFNLIKFASIIGITICFVLLAFLIFYIGLKRYSSTNLMNARV